MATKLDLTSGVVWVLNAINLNVATLTTTRNGIATTSTDGLILANTTASTAGVPVQQSPRIRLRSNVWNTTVTAANNTNDWIIESVPVSGAAPSGQLFVRSSLNGAAYATKLRIDSAGQVRGDYFIHNAGLAFYGRNPADTADVYLAGIESTGVNLTNNFYVGTSFYGLRSPGGGDTSAVTYIQKVVGIADNVATTVLTVTIPNGNHAAAIKLTFLSSNGSTDAFESSRVATGHVVVARTTGANAVATAAAIDDAAIATVVAGATHTLAYNVSAIAGAAGASNTFTIQVTIDDSGNLGSNQVVVLAELINAEATGVTIA